MNVTTWNICKAFAGIINVSTRATVRRAQRTKKHKKKHRNIRVTQKITNILSLENKKASQIFSVSVRLT